MNNKGLHLNIPDANIELHAHPLLHKNRFLDVALEIEAQKLDIVALEAIDKSIYEKICGQISNYYRILSKDNAGVIYGDSYLHNNSCKVFLNAREYTTKESFHLLTIGHSVEARPKTEIRKLIDEGLKNNALIVIAHTFVDNEKTKHAGHISESSVKELEKLCGEYSGNICLEWNGYCNPTLRWGLKQGLNLFGHKIKYHDVNKRAESFSFEQAVKHFNIPIVSGTDLHAVNNRYMKAIGTSRIIMDVEGETASDILDSMKKHIFTRDYSNTREYVSAQHVLGAFCLPILWQKK